MYQLAPTANDCLPEAGVFGHSFRETGMLIAGCDGSVRNILPVVRPMHFDYLLCPGDGDPFWGNRWNDD
jgi:hypothetical protein